MIEPIDGLVPQRPIVLASQSPRRRELLDQIGVAYEVSPVDIDESVRAGEEPLAYVERLAREKCLAAANRGLPALGADTTVIASGKILGKPGDEAEAASMLRNLSGKAHRVATAVAIHWDGQLASVVQVSKVHFANLSDDAIEAYVATGEGRDKAGAYAIQGHAAQFITAIEGSYSGIMGLPLYETAQLLRRISHSAIGARA